jgi:hypothetical protein
MHVFGRHDINRINMGDGAGISGGVSGYGVVELPDAGFANTV